MGCVVRIGGGRTMRGISENDGLVRLDQNPFDARPGDILAFSCMRNEILRLPYFLDYYRKLGVSRFVVVDNDSTDGTRRFLLSQQDVHLFHTEGSYSGSYYGVDWLNLLLGRFGRDHWVVVVDADELLIYPNSETVVLLDLVRRLETGGFDAMLTFLLDMYASGPIREAHYSPGAPFLERCPYFDSDSYTLGGEGMRAKVPATGGVRQRLFWKVGRERRGKPPYLPKIPLVKWSSGLKYSASTHVIKDLRLAPFTGVLLHFKLFSDFVERTMIEVKRREHWDDAAQYEVYAEGLAAYPDLDPMYEGSVRFLNSRQLVEMGLLIE
jgi:hypothetical protein